MPIEVLIQLTQALPDPSSGAARSMHFLGALLARARTATGAQKFHVRFLGSTATEDGGLAPDGVSFFRRLGISPTLESLPLGRVLRCRDHGIDCTLLDTSGRPEALDVAQHAALDHLLDEMVAANRPDLVVTFGGTPKENSRRMRLHAQGIPILFRLCNWGYLHAPKDFFCPAHGIDAVLATSDYLHRRYQVHFALPACTAVLPTAVIDESVVAVDHATPGAVTFVNPSLEKGVMVFVRIADELARRRPDIPLLVVEGRGSLSDLRTAASFAAVDLSRHPNLRVIRSLPLPRDLFALTRIILVPSVWEEPCGRLVCEALLNGVPPIVSDRGGLPDECHQAGSVIALPQHIQPHTYLPLTAAEVEPWIEAIVRLWDSPTAYATASAAAFAAARFFRPEVTQARIEDFIQQVMALR
jgi:glycosyltransferase involved in cell wall biosynthesis